MKYLEQFLEIILFVRNYQLLIENRSIDKEISIVWSFQPKYGEEVQQ